MTTLILPFSTLVRPLHYPCATLTYATILLTKIVLYFYIVIFLYFMMEPVSLVRKDGRAAGIAAQQWAQVVVVGASSRQRHDDKAPSCAIRTEVADMFAWVFSGGLMFHLLGVRARLFKISYSRVRVEPARAMASNAPPRRALPILNASALAGHFLFVSRRWYGLSSIPPFPHLSEAGAPDHPVFDAALRISRAVRCFLLLLLQTGIC